MAVSSQDVSQIRCEAQQDTQRPLVGLAVGASCTKQGEWRNVVALLVIGPLRRWLRGSLTRTAAASAVCILGQRRLGQAFAEI